MCIFVSFLSTLNTGFASTRQLGAWFGSWWLCCQGLSYRPPIVINWHRPKWRIYEQHPMIVYYIIIYYSISKFSGISIAWQSMYLHVFTWSLATPRLGFEHDLFWSILVLLRNPTMPKRIQKEHRVIGPPLGLHWASKRFQAIPNLRRPPLSRASAALLLS